jgi:hypothetical protein
MSIVDAAIGGAVGYASSRTKDAATTWYYEQMSEESKRHEEEALPGGTALSVGRTVGRLVGSTPDDEQAVKLGMATHRLLAITYGMLAARMVAGGSPPIRVGLATGAAVFVVVDEITNALVFTPPPGEYPIESHLRGVVGHLAYGAAVGLLLGISRGAGLIGR